MGKFNDLIKRSDVKESNVKMYETNNYKLFCSLEGNRNVTRYHVEKIKKSILAGGDLKSPVVVNENLEVIDGQNTFEARKELGLKIYFYCVPGASIESCRAMNTSSMNWTLNDFANSYAVDNEEYKTLAEFCKTHNVSVYIVHGMVHGVKVGNTIKDGTFCMTAEEYSNVEKALGYIPQIHSTLGFTGRIDPTFRRAVYLMITNPKYDHKRMMRQCKKYDKPVKKMRKVRDALVLLSDVYSTKNDPVHFEDIQVLKNVENRDYSSMALPRKDNKNISTLKNE